MINLLPEISGIIEHGAYRIPAKDIFNRLNELKNQKDIAKRRWFWELLQNAKDSVADQKKKKVDVSLVLENDSLIFTHNGNPFTLTDAINLIRPDSTKSEDKDQFEQSLTGRFGTGFLATHILSKCIKVSGVVNLGKSEFKNFAFDIDRSSASKEAIAENIKQSVVQFSECIKQNPQLKSYVPNKKLDTTFTYWIDKTAYDLIKVSMAEIEMLLPYVMVFLPQIATVKLKTEGAAVTYQVQQSVKHGDLRLYDVGQTRSGKVKTYKIATISEDSTTLAIEYEEKQGNFYFREFSTKMPLLFCDFPLIGTENFSFPMIINSSDFIPKTERNGIWLQEDEENNKAIFEDVIVPLFSTFLAKIEDKKWKNTFLIAKIRVPEIDDFDGDWFKECVQDPIRQKLLHASIVSCSNSKRTSILNEEGTGNVYFPDATRKEVREKIWHFSNILFPNSVPLKSEIHNWHSVIWADCYKESLEELASDYAYSESISKLAERIKSEKTVSKKLMLELIGFISKEEPSLFESNAILLNQNNEFRKKNELYLDDIELDDAASEKLKDILALLGEDCRENLLSKDIDLDLSYSIDQVEIADNIIRLIRPLVSVDYEPDEDEIQIILSLLEWLEENIEIAEDLFSEIYTIRDRLYTSSLSGDEKTNLLKILRNQNGYKLDKIAEIVNLPGVSAYLDLLIMQQKEKDFLTSLGAKVEDLFEKAFEGQEGIEIQKVFYGQDFILTIKGRKTEYAVEIKSTVGKTVAMTGLQGRTAVSKPDSYALCVLHKNGSDVTTDYFKKNSRFVPSIGKLLKQKVQKEELFRQSQSNIDSSADDIKIELEGALQTKFRINKKIWSEGLTFNQFVAYVKGNIK